MEEKLRDEVERLRAENAALRKYQNTGWEDGIEAAAAMVDALDTEDPRLNWGDAIRGIKRRAVEATRSV